MPDVENPHRARRHFCLVPRPNWPGWSHVARWFAVCWVPVVLWDLQLHGGPGRMSFLALVLSNLFNLVLNLWLWQTRRREQIRANQEEGKHSAQSDTAHVGEVDLPRLRRGIRMPQFTLCTMMIATAVAAFILALATRVSGIELLGWLIVLCVISPAYLTFLVFFVEERIGPK